MSNLDSLSLLQCTDIGCGASVAGKKKDRSNTHDDPTKHIYYMGEATFSYHNFSLDWLLYLLINYLLMLLVSLVPLAIVYTFPITSTKC